MEFRATLDKRDHDWVRLYQQERFNKNNRAYEMLFATLHIDSFAAMFGQVVLDDLRGADGDEGVWVELVGKKAKE